VKVGGLLPLQKLARYKLEIAEAVQKEEFEKAARLRDRIKDLEHQLTRQPKRPKSISDVA
jgi:protein-arginine kinase activator protein McsA